MGRAAKPTRSQKEILTQDGLNWKDWLVVRDGMTIIQVVSKASGRPRTIKKPQQVRTARASGNLKN